MVGKAWPSKPHHECEESERVMLDLAQLSAFPHFIESGPLDHGLVLPIFSLGLLSPVPSLWKCPQQVLPEVCLSNLPGESKLVQLTVEISHHNLP